MNNIAKLLEAHADKTDKLTIRKIMVDRNEPGEVDPAPLEEYFQVEGSEDSLRFLGELLIAFAEGDLGCNLDLHPRGAGKAHFSQISECGIELHKIPCDFETKGG